MGFLPCPRLRRETARSSEPDDNNSLQDGSSDCSVPEALAPLPEDQLDEEGRALAGFFRPLATTRSDTIPSRSRSVVSRANTPRSQTVTQKKSRASLTSLPGKLRRKLSRDARSSKRRQDLASSQYQVRTSDIFRTGRADDGGYDSDAHYLQTPQITQRLEGSPSSVHLQPGKRSALSNESPQDGLVSVSTGEAVSKSVGIRDEERIPGSRHAAPEDVDMAPEGIAEGDEDPPRTSTPETQNGTIDGAVYGTPTESYFGDQAFFTPRESTSPPRGEAHLNAEASAARTREDSSSRSQNTGHAVSSSLSRGSSDGSRNLDVSNMARNGNRDRTPRGDGDLGPGGLSREPSLSQNAIPCSHLAMKDPCFSGSYNPVVFNRTASVYRSQSVYSDPPPSFNLSTPPCLSQTAQWKEVQGDSRNMSPLTYPASDTEYPTTASTHHAETLSVQNETALAQNCDEVNKKRSKFSLLRGTSSLILKPRRGGQGDLQVSKRISPPSSGSRFVENFDDSASCIEPETQLHDEDGRRRRSDGWLSGGKRLGYGYNFVTDLEKGSTLDTDVERTEEAHSGEQQSTDCSAGSTGRDETGHNEHVDVGGKHDDNQSSRAKSTITGLEAKVSQLRRSLSITSLAKSQRSTMKEGPSLGAVPEDHNAQNLSKGKEPATAAAETGTPLNGSRRKSLLKPWSRSSRNNSTVIVTKQNVESYETKNGGTKQRDQTKHAMPGNCSGSHGALGELSESKKNVKHSSPRVVSQDSHPSTSGISSSRPGQYDGPFDVKPQRITSGHSSVDGVDQGDTGVLTGVKSAETWSRMYRDCLPHLSMSDETIVGRPGPDDGKIQYGTTRLQDA